MVETVSRVPFPLISYQHTRLQLDENRCFEYQARERLPDEQHTEMLTVAGTTGYGKSYMLAALVFLLLKHRHELAKTNNRFSGDDDRVAPPVVVYIPDCRSLLQCDDLLLQTMRDSVLLNFPAHQDPLLSIQDVRVAFKGRAVILVVDQWEELEATDDGNKCCRGVTSALRECLGASNVVVRVHGTAMTPTVYINNTSIGARHSDTTLCYGGLSDKEFRVWMEHQDNDLLRANEVELVHLTGRTPLLLSVFAREYQAKIVVGALWTWDALVEQVTSSKEVQDMDAELGRFYKDHNAATVWKVFQLVASSPSVNTLDVDRRFFYQQDSSRLWFAIGDIALHLLFHVWKARVWKEKAGSSSEEHGAEIARRLQVHAKRVSSPYLHRFLAFELAQAVSSLARDELRGVTTAPATAAE